MKLRYVLLGCALALPLPAAAADLTPAEQKQIANLTAQIDLVDALHDKQIANIQAQMDLVIAQNLKQTADLRAQINFIRSTAEAREAARRAKCKVPVLWLGCPPKSDDLPDEWAAFRRVN